MRDQRRALNFSSHGSHRVNVTVIPANLKTSFLRTRGVERYLRRDEVAALVPCHGASYGDVLRPPEIGERNHVAPGRASRISERTYRNNEAAEVAGLLLRLRNCPQRNTAMRSSHGQQEYSVSARPRIPDPGPAEGFDARNKKRHGADHGRITPRRQATRTISTAPEAYSRLSSLRGLPTRQSRRRPFPATSARCPGAQQLYPPR